MPCISGHLNHTVCSTLGWVTQQSFCFCKVCWRWCAETRYWIWYRRVGKNYSQDSVASNRNFLSCCMPHEAAEPSLQSPALPPSCEMISWPGLRKRVRSLSETFVAFRSILISNSFSLYSASFNRHTNRWMWGTFN